MPIAEPLAPAPTGKNKGRTRLPECYHCGAGCLTDQISVDDHFFCCDGCRLVYELISSNGLCNYYELEHHPGLNGIKAVRSGQYDFLDDPAIARRLCSFSDGDYTVVTLYIPGVHCSSCMWLLTHLSRINPGITESRLNFTAKEVTIHFSAKAISLREMVSLLATIGYEPHISLQDGEEQQAAKPDRTRLYRLGIAGFCFSFIMMMSFPEYFGGAGFDHQYALIFRTLNLVLSLPVFFFCAGEFFGTAWKGLKAKTLNIDAPIALAILITFSRSVYEIATGTGAGYLDSMSGIVFFMLVGRMVQDRTYRSISFHRDYKSYFPIAVTVLTDQGAEARSLHELQVGDVVQLRHGELVPADGIVLEGHACIDYSFVTGESEPVTVPAGNLLYAGGRQTDEQITFRVEKPVAGSYLTSLWNHQAFSRNKTAEAQAGSSIHVLSKYFTVVLFALAAMTGLYWLWHDPSRMLNSITAMLIVACPCALLLSATFTNGNLLRLFSNSGLFLRDAAVIEELGKIDHIVFDKTGTLTRGTTAVPCRTPAPDVAALTMIHSLAQSSNHPYSRALAHYTEGYPAVPVTGVKEHAGLGIEGTVAGTPVRLGSALFIGCKDEGANVYALVGDRLYAFRMMQELREGVAPMIQRLQTRYGVSLLSGDHAQQMEVMRPLFGPNSTLLFGQKPVEKLSFIETLQQQHHQVLMVGDGLNDAGALQQSNVGITLASDINNFSPACDAILDAARLKQLPALLQLARAGKAIIRLSFGVSILYNLCGLYFAVQGKMNPMIAAILMPASTLTIVLISTGLTALAMHWLHLRSAGPQAAKNLI